MTPAIFVSFAHPTKQRALWLAEELRRTGYSTVIEDDFGVSSPRREMADGVGRSDVVIALVTDAYATGLAPGKELDWAEAYGKPVIAAFVGLSSGAALARRFLTYRRVETLATWTDSDAQWVEVKELILRALAAASHAIGRPAQRAGQEVAHGAASPAPPLAGQATRRKALVGAATVVGASLSALAPVVGLSLLGTFAMVVLSAAVSFVAAAGVSGRKRLQLAPPPDARDQQVVAAIRRGAPILSQFAGRTAELAQLREEHDRWRGARSRPGPQEFGPVVLAIHGPAGVGKTVFAHELARSLQQEYPDGYLVANFGAGGTTRGPADISRDFLLQLGWPERDMPDETEDRVATLRSLTRGKRMLFLFDAARDHDQVRQVIPAESHCAVIITSRRELASSLGLAPHAALGYTSTEDSLEIFSAISGFAWIRDAESAIEIIDLCGRLPLAIRSAAERVRDGTSIRHVAELLRPESRRLSALEYGGRAVRDRIRSEYERLQSEHRIALTLLTTMPSDTFVPWVLRPLMQLEQGQSAGVVASLAAAQLVEPAGYDGTEQPRYRIHPLVRIFARSRQHPGQLDAGWQRLEDGYADLVDDVLRERGDGYRHVRGGEPRRWRTPKSTIAERIPPTLDQIVRREFPNLVRVIGRLDGVRYAGLIWRVAALLRDGVPAHADAAELALMFERAGRASKHDRAPFGEVDVALAHAQFLAATEQYGAAFDLLDWVVIRLDALGPASAPPEPVVVRRLRTVRVRAAAYVQVGAYYQAVQVLARVDDLLGHLPAGPLSRPVRTDLRLLLLLFDATRLVPADSPHWQAAAKGDVDEEVAFRTWLEESEQMRNRRYWREAGIQLREERLGRDGDARGIATIQYRLARLAVDEARHLDPTNTDGRAALGRTAVRNAALCAVTFGTIADEVGRFRARCLLVRALVLVDELMAATQLCLEMDTWIRAESRKSSHALLPMRARFARARGELQLAYKSYHSAWRSLTMAASVFAELHDWSSQADTWSLLDQIRRGQASALGDVLHNLDPDGA